MAKNKVSKYSQAIGLNIKKIIQDTNNTQESAANLLNINRATLTNYLNGKRDIPYDILIKVCNSFKTTPNELLGFEDISTSGTINNIQLVINIIDTLNFFLKKQKYPKKTGQSSLNIFMKKILQRSK